MTDQCRSWLWCHHTERARLTYDRSEPEVTCSCYDAPVKALPTEDTPRNSELEILDSYLLPIPFWSEYVNAHTFTIRLALSTFPVYSAVPPTTFVHNKLIFDFFGPLNLFQFRSLTVNCSIGFNQWPMALLQWSFLRKTHLYWHSYVLNDHQYKGASDNELCQ